MTVGVAARRAAHDDRMICRAPSRAPAAPIAASPIRAAISGNVGRQLLGQQANEIPDLVQPPSADVADRARSGVQLVEGQRAIGERVDADRLLGAHGGELVAASPQAARRGAPIDLRRDPTASAGAQRALATIEPAGIIPVGGACARLVEVGVSRAGDELRRRECRGPTSIARG